MSFASMLNGLVRAEVQFIVIGGVAGAIHGSQRVTNDLDVVYDAVDEGNIHRLARLLAEWRAYPRAVEKGLPFLMDARTLAACPVLTLTSIEGDIDVMDAIDGLGSYAKAARHTELVRAFGIEFRTLTLRGLIRAKRAAGRPKDREALIELEALLAME